jgi:hypothetical protein
VSVDELMRDRMLPVTPSGYRVAPEPYKGHSRAHAVAYCPNV